MFNLFGSNPKEYKISKDEEFWQSVPIEPPKHSYTVGVNESGETVLMLKTESGTTTMTLNQSGTISLIRLLEATLPIEDNNEGCN